MFVTVLFILSAALTVISALMSALTRHIMHSCVYLFGSLLGVAGLYLTLGADYLSAVQIMVYVGGVVILMLFAVLLTGGKEFMDRSSIHIRDHFMGTKKNYFLGILAAIVFLSTVTGIIFQLSSLSHSGTIAPVVFTVKDIGKSLVTDHLLAFELSSVLLLGALIGAAILARPRQE